MDRELLGTPLEGRGGVLTSYAEQFKVDPLLLMAIMYHESVYCSVYSPSTLEKKNCAGIMRGGQRMGLTSFREWNDFLMDFTVLINKYIYTYELDTIGKIGARYAPVGAHQMNTSWQGAVTRKYDQLWGQLGN